MSTQNGFILPCAAENSILALNSIKNVIENTI